MDLNALSPLLAGCPYPESLQHVDRGILGPGFYPGAPGFPSSAPCTGGIMLLGRDFGTVTYHKRLCGTPAREETATTWRHTRDIYLAGLAGLPVWCTNYLPGLRKSGSSVGNIAKKTPPNQWQPFEAYCWQFLQSQVLLQRPLVVVVLGGDNRQDLSTKDRLGPITEHPKHYTFSLNADEHSALITFADHPHSLIPKSRQEDARLVAMGIRSIFEEARATNKLR